MKEKIIYSSDTFAVESIARSCGVPFGLGELANLLKTDGAFGLLRYDEDVPVSFVIAKPIGKDLRIVRIATKPEHQGFGHGTALLANLAARSQSLKKYLTVHLDKDHAAYDWFIKKGFQKVNGNNTGTVRLYLNTCTKEEELACV